MSKKFALWNIPFAVLMTIAGLVVLHIFWATPVTWKSTLIVFGLSYPWKIKNNIYSLFGGINPDGGVYSAIGIVQVAKKHAFAVGGMIFQRSLEGTTFQIIGVNIMQWGQIHCVQFLGVNFFQVAETGNVIQVIGINAFQIGKESSVQVIGITGLQAVTREGTADDWVGAAQIFGIILYQEAQQSFQFFGITFWNKIKEKSTQIVGILGHQGAQKTSNGFGIVFHRNSEAFTDDSFVLKFL